MLRTIVGLCLFLLGSNSFASNAPPWQSALDEHGFFRPEFEQVIVTSFNPYRGDTVIDTLPVISALRLRYPHLPVVVQTYINDTIKPGPHVAMIKPALGEIITPSLLSAYAKTEHPKQEPLFWEAAESLADQAVQGVVKDKPVLMFFNSCALWCLMRENLEQHHIISHIDHEADSDGFWTRYEEFRTIVEEEISARLPQGSLLITGDLLSDLHLRMYEIKEPVIMNEISFDVSGTRNVYQVSSGIMSSGFGAEGLGLEQDQYFVNFSDENEFIKLRESTFSNPGREFIVLNFNTVGAYKLGSLSQYQFKLASSLIEFLRTSYPELNIWITPPELPKGTTHDVRPELERQHQLIRELVHSPQHSGHVAFLPEDNKLSWNNAVRDAKCVISQDSGFLHMCNLVRPHSPAQILSYSFDDLAPKWSKPSQPSIAYLQAPKKFSKRHRYHWKGIPHPEFLNLSAVYEMKHWLQEQLGSTPQSKKWLKREGMELLSDSNTVERLRAINAIFKNYEPVTTMQARKIKKTAVELLHLFRQEKKHRHFNNAMLSPLGRLMVAGILVPEYGKFMEPLSSYLWKIPLAYDVLMTLLSHPVTKPEFLEMAEQFAQLPELEPFLGMVLTKEKTAWAQDKLRERIAQHRTAASCHNVLVTEPQE